MADAVPGQDGHDENAPAVSGKTRQRNLTVRVVSSIILIPLAVAPILIGGWAFRLLAAFAMLIMLFEWARMVERRPRGPVFFALAGCGALSIFALWADGFATAFAVTGAGAVAAALFGRTVAERGWGAFGAFYILVPVMALIWLRSREGDGLALTLIVFTTVWATDIGAYFGGRYIGGPKLNPWISPQKTWAGTLSGVAAGAVMAGGMALLFLPGGPWFSFAFAGAGLSAASVVGDIVESAMKRGFGVKDSGAIIPGHGGLLDRLDGMIFATVAITLTLAVNLLGQRLITG